MLKAQFKNTTSKGGVVYVVDGTPEELQEYMASVPQEWIKSHQSEDGRALLFSSFAMPGKRDAWHPLYKVQNGPNAGRYTLDTDDLRFKEAQLKSVKNPVLADKMADAIVSDIRGTIKQSLISAVQVTAEPNLADGDINNVD